jgi:methionyl-tRNA synthetase
MDQENKKFISIDDVAKVEIKIGTVKRVDEVEGSDKLYRLEVDFNEKVEIESETGTEDLEGRLRTVFSGIRKYVKPEDLLNKQFIFVTNLEPRKMMGQYSEAMILAASETLDNGENKEERFTLFSPAQEMTNGLTLR